MKLITDEKGIVIREFDLLKVFHFTGARRKKNYMYKWVRLNQGELYGYHLADASVEGFFLWVVAPGGIFIDAEIIQTRPGNSGCDVNTVGSRVCERGTKGCVKRHCD